MEEKIKALKENMNSYENWGDPKYKGLLEHVLKHYPDVSDKQLKTIEINYSYLQKWLKNSTNSTTKNVNIDAIKKEIKKYFKFLSPTDKEIDEILDYLKEHLEKKVVYYWNTSDFDGIMISVGPNEDCWDTLTEYMDKNLVKLLNNYPAFIKDSEYHVKTFEDDLYTTKDLKEFEDYLKKNGWTAIRIKENEDSDDLDELHNGFYEHEEDGDEDEEVEVSDGIKFLSTLIKGSSQRKTDRELIQELQDRVNKYFEKLDKE